jgi:glycosyltransferase involved in cell wall biosynthesis
MSAPEITVIIPAYNRRQTIVAAVTSALHQTLPPREVIVVDDGSSDGTAQHVEALDEPSVRVVQTGRNRGPGTARNLGVELARGRFVAFLDSDDEWLEDKLSIQIAALDALGAVPASVFCDFYYSRPGRRTVVRATTPGTGWLASIVAGIFPAPGTTLLAHRECFDQVGGFPQDLDRFEDVDWLLRAARQCLFTTVPTPLALVHGGSSPPPETVRACARRLLERHRDWLHDRPLPCLGRLEATMAFEVAVALLRHGHRGRAGLQVARALLRHPPQAMVLLRRLARVLGER